MGFRGGFLFGAVLGVIITALLFYFVQGLITPERIQPPGEASGDGIKLEKVRPDEPPETPEPPDEPQEPVDPPPPPKLETPPLDPPGGEPVPPLQPPVVSDPPTGVTPGTDFQLSPIVRLQPDYPRQDAANGREGFVVVEFTVAADGTTKDIVVIESTNARFARAATRAIEGWRYRPQTEGGRPVDRPGQRVRLDFTLTET